MPNINETMRQLHNIYAKEVDETIENLIKSKQDSNLVLESEDDDLVVYDNYMSILTETMNMVRKLNCRLQMADLRKVLWTSTNLNGEQTQQQMRAAQPRTPISLITTKEYSHSNTSVNSLVQQTEKYQKTSEIFSNNASADHSGSPTNLPVEKVTSSSYTNLKCSEPRFVYKMPDFSVFKLGDIIKASICSILDLERLVFYVIHLENESSRKVAELAGMKHMRQYNEMPGNEVFGLAMDGYIYRAVREISDGGDSKKTMLIDLGELTESDSGSIMYRLDPEMQQLPAQAILCKLDYNQGELNNDLQEFLKNLEFEKVHMKIKAVLDNMLQIEIIVNEDIINCMPNSSFECVTKSVQTPKSPNKNNPFYGELSPEDLEMLKEEPLATTNAMKAVMGYDPKDDKRICPFYDPKINGCFKGAKCKLEHTAKHPEGWTKDVEPEAKIGNDFSTTDRFVRGVTINITITHIAGVDRFYANINDKKNPTDPLIWAPNSVADERRLQRLPKLFEIVLAQYHDKHWYRARVEETKEIAGLVKVFYVDYGNEQLVHISNLSHCDVGIAQMPFRAVLCRLANVSTLHIPIERRNLGVHYLNQTILNGTIYVKVESNHEELWISFTDDFHKGVVENLKAMKAIHASETIVL